MKYTAIFAALLLTGCASPEKVSRLKMQSDMTDAVKTAATKPLISIECPTTGCNFTKLEVANPYAVQQLAQVVAPIFAPQRSEAAEIALAFIGGVTEVGKVGAIGSVIKGTVGKIVQGNVDISNGAFDVFRQQAASPVIPSVVVNASQGSGVGILGGTGSGSHSAPVTTTSTTTTSTTTTSTTSSNNRTATGGNTTAAGAGGGASTGP